MTTQYDRPSWSCLHPSFVARRFCLSCAATQTISQHIIIIYSKGVEISRRFYIHCNVPLFSLLSLSQWLKQFLWASGDATAGFTASQPLATHVHFKNIASIKTWWNTACHCHSIHSKCTMLWMGSSSFTPPLHRMSSGIHLLYRRQTDRHLPSFG